MSEEGRVGRSVGPAEQTLQAWSSLQLQWRCSGTSSSCCCCAGGGGRAADIFVHNNARGRGPSAAGNHGGRQAAVRISRWVAEAASGQCGGQSQLRRRLHVAAETPRRRERCLKVTGTVPLAGGGWCDEPGRGLAAERGTRTARHW